MDSEYWMSILIVIDSLATWGIITVIYKTQKNAKQKNKNRFTSKNQYLHQCKKGDCFYPF